MISITGIMNTQSREAHVIKAFEKMTAGLLVRVNRMRMRRARAAYKKLVYDRKFQQQKYHSKKQEHKRNEV
jgi:hypothetical protein